MPVRILYLLICMTILGTMKGCAPKPAPGMSPEDLQTCDDTAATVKAKYTFPVSAYEAKYFPWLVTPGEAEITSPASASIFPYGEPVDISFTQAPPDPNVTDRIIKVFVTPINTVNLTELPTLFSLFGKVPSAYQQSFGSNWTPGSSGNFIILVLSWNLKNGGYPKGSAKIDFGPPSLAYVCVKIDPVKAAGAQSLQPVTMMPLGNVTLPPTITRTVTPWPTITRTPTLTPTETATSTFTRVPPTRKPPTPVPPTPVPPTPIPPTEVVNCSSYPDARTCEANPVCTWGHLPSGAEACVNR